MGTKLHCYLNKFAVAGDDWLLLLDHQASFVIVETQKESNPANTCSKSTIETLEKDAKYVQS